MHLCGFLSMGTWNGINMMLAEHQTVRFSQDCSDHRRSSQYRRNKKIALACPEQYSQAPSLRLKTVQWQVLRLNYAR